MLELIGVDGGTFPVDGDFLRANLSVTTLKKISEQIKGYVSLNRCGIEWRIYSRSASSELLDSEMRTVQLMWEAASTFEAHSQMPDVVVTAFLLDSPKIFDRTAPICSPDVMNTGFAADGGRIVLYRTQEIAKVLLHELVHASGSDCRWAEWPFDPVFDVVGPHQPYEAIAEAKAQLMYSAIVSRHLRESYEDVLRAQADHGMRMCALILRLNGVSDIGRAIASKARWTQGTYALEYFFYRSAIVFMVSQGHLSYEAVIDSGCERDFHNVLGIAGRALYGEAGFLKRIQEYMDEVDVGLPAYSITMNLFV